MTFYFVYKNRLRCTHFILSNGHFWCLYIGLVKQQRSHQEHAKSIRNSTSDTHRAREWERLTRTILVSLSKSSVFWQMIFFLAMNGSFTIFSAISFGIHLFSEAIHLSQNIREHLFSSYFHHKMAYTKIAEWKFMAATSKY